MSLFDDIKAKADTNGDGKINKDDLEALRSGDNNDLINKLKDLADQNDDGKLNLNDLKQFDLGDTVNDLKDKFFN